MPTSSIKCNEQVMRNLKRGVSIAEQHAEWLEDNPLDARRPDLCLAEAGCPEVLKELVVCCWADSAAERPTFIDVIKRLQCIELRPVSFASSKFKVEYERTSAPQYVLN